MILNFFNFFLKNTGNYEYSDRVKSVLAARYSRAHVSQHYTGRTMYFYIFDKIFDNKIH